MSIILILLILIWLILYFILRWRWNRILAADFPLFLLCNLLLVTGITAHETFGENRQIGLNMAWLPILYWLYLRKKDVIFLFEYKPVNLVAGFLIGLVLGTGVAVFVTGPLNSIDSSKWIPGLVFDLIQKSIAEEIVFRCLLINYLKKYNLNNLLINLVQGLIFGVFHIGTYWQSPVLLLIPISLGLLTGFIVMKQKSIYGSILAHVLNNLIIFVRALTY
jgi:membrane protease YdiL (CAAX protease family)